MQHLLAQRLSQTLSTCNAYRCTRQSPEQRSNDDGHDVYPLCLLDLTPISLLHGSSTQDSLWTSWAAQAAWTTIDTYCGILPAERPRHNGTYNAEKISGGRMGDAGDCGIFKAGITTVPWYYEWMIRRFCLYKTEYNEVL